VTLFKQLNDAIDAQYQKGYAAAIEDAVKVAQDHHSNQAGHQDHGFDECAIAKLIKALLSRGSR
jgi:hypothetical protein